MKHIISLLVLAAALLSGYAQAASVGNTPLPVDVRYLANSTQKGALYKVKLGTQLVDHKVQVLKAIYDFAVLGGASGATLTLRDEGNQPSTIAAKAVIKQVNCDVLTAPTSAGSATISLGIAPSVTNLKAATAIASWTGEVAGVPIGTSATMIKQATQSTIQAQILAAALTAGKIECLIEYYVSD